MKYALLVAWREYVESAKAKGFWIGILLMPTIIFLSIQAPFWLEQKATPIRYYTIVDQSGDLGPAIETRIERTHQERVLEALREYARKNSAGNGDTNANMGSVEAFIAAGGKEAFLKQLQ